MTTDTSRMSLREALDHTYRTRWAHTRDGGKCLMSQAEAAVSSVLDAHLGEDNYVSRPQVIVEEIGDRDVRQATALWYAKGLSPATINKRLNCLSALGVNVEGMRRKPPKALKWFLSEDAREKVLAYCATQPDGRGYRTLETYITWTTLTGLRIEESLRLTRGDFVWDDNRPVEVKVPGTKTSESQATLPLGEKASYLVEMAFLGLPSGYDRSLFQCSYEQLNGTWQEVRRHFGWDKNPTATLKALRRSAARYLHVDCGMPLDMVRQYLRHEDIKTTMEYLRLTGGYNTEEMRRYLK